MPRPRESTADAFAPLRPRLIRIAYRMLGSVAEAEDIVQDAYLRWHQTDRIDIRDPAAFLARTVARLCLDYLKSARVRRESYVGAWLPDPMIEADDEAAGDDITLTLMMALERLSPLERAAFLLHDVFSMGFDDVARTIDRDEAACRQLAARARNHVKAARLRFPVSDQRGKEIAGAFFDASRNGDVTALQSLLAADVIFYSDGGGKRPATLNPIYGLAKVTRLFIGLMKHAAGGSSMVATRMIDGLPGFVSFEADGLIQTTALQIENGRVTAVYVVRNPDKLGHLAIPAYNAVRH